MLKFFSIPKIQQVLHLIGALIHVHLIRCIIISPAYLYADGYILVFAVLFVCSFFRPISGNLQQSFILKVRTRAECIKYWLQLF